jgi:serine/threonine protein kinase
VLYCGPLEAAAISDSGPQIAVPFGKYLLIKRLATGGMAELFLAQDEPESPLVVIKRILPYLSSEPDFVRMFLDEARIAAQLTHPNIVQTHELGKLEDSIFLAMEYVEGADLRKLLKKEQEQGGSIPYNVAARIVADVCAGLHFAHNCAGVDGRKMEIVHRDISPQNVMVAFDGHVKLVDFGIARANSFMERSQPGVLKGKFLYLSPEQVLQQPLDHRADLFAIGTLLYEITTGKTPFQRTSAEAVLYAIRHEQPPAPQLLKSDFPPALAQIVAKCLTKDREKRYQQADEIARDLEAFLANNPATSQTISDYIAALFGDADERTILNIPSVGASSQKTLIAPQVLAPPPTRRPTEQRPRATHAELPIGDTDPHPPPLPQAPPTPPRKTRGLSNPPAAPTTPRPTRLSKPPPPVEPEEPVEGSGPIDTSRTGSTDPSSDGGDTGRIDHATRLIANTEADNLQPPADSGDVTGREGRRTKRRGDTGEAPTLSEDGEAVTIPPYANRTSRKPARAEAADEAFPVSEDQELPDPEFSGSTTHRSPSRRRLGLIVIGGLLVFLLAGVGVLSYRVHQPPAPPSRDPVDAPRSEGQKPEASPARAATAQQPEPPPVPDPAPVETTTDSAQPKPTGARIVFHPPHGATIVVAGLVVTPGKAVEVAPGRLHYTLRCPGHRPEDRDAEVEANPAKLQTIAVKCHR